METTPKPQPLRLNIQVSIVVPDPGTAEQIYNSVGELVKLAEPSAMIAGNVLKMLGPCCGDKKT